MFLHRAVSALVLLLPLSLALADTRQIATPPDSWRFGESVHVLPNGNIVVVDPGAAVYGVPGVGAVYLYSPDGVLISRLHGGAAGDRIGDSGIVILANGNFVVRSRYWGYAYGAYEAGAVTFVDASTGRNGVVDAQNSIVGHTAADNVSFVTPLANGNYIVYSMQLDVAGATNAGGAMWGDGVNGTAGVMTAQNTVHGATGGDFIAEEGVIALANGNAVVASPSWNFNRGAATFMSGTQPTTGAVSAANSLVGAQPYDYVGSDVTIGPDLWSLVSRSSVLALPNGHYVVAAPSWDNGAKTNVGAVAWGNGNIGTAGVMSAANARIGDLDGSQLGAGGLYALGNSAVIVSSPWFRDASSHGGAVTRLDATGPFSGVVSAMNSLVGRTLDDRVGQAIAVLANGHYVVGSDAWDGDTLADVGAFTWCHGVAGCVGTVTPANSTVGSQAGDRVGVFIEPLANGNYVVRSPGWDNGAIVDAGAVTFASGNAPTIGTLSASNSLVGSTAADFVGQRFLALTDGNWLTSTISFDNGALSNVGAVIRGNGATGTIGPITPANAVLGQASGEAIAQQLFALSQGRSILYHPLWRNAANEPVGAVTFAAAGPVTGVIDETNSLVGDRIDNLGMLTAAPQADGRAVLHIGSYDTDAAPNVGAVVVAPATGLRGRFPTGDVLIGAVEGEGPTMKFAYDPFRGHVVASDPASNRVVILGVLLTSGFEDQEKQQEASSTGH